MNKIKGIIHKIKASIYGVAGRAQFPDKLTEPAPMQKTVAEEPKIKEVTKSEIKEEPANKLVKKAATKKVTPAKKPGRPKGSKSTPKN